jgi:hypothetical protein
MLEHCNYISKQSCRQGDQVWIFFAYFLCDFFFIYRSTQNVGTTLRPKIDWATYRVIFSHTHLAILLFGDVLSIQKSDQTKQQ